MQPPEIDKLDTALRTQLHRGRWYAVAVLAVIVAAAIAVFTYTYIAQQQQLRQSCDFFAELGTISITPPKGQPPPSRLAVLLQANSRKAYLGEGCGTLPPPAPTLRTYAARYHIRLPG